MVVPNSKVSQRLFVVWINALIFLVYVWAPIAAASDAEPIVHVPDDLGFQPAVVLLVAVWFQQRVDDRVEAVLQLLEFPLAAKVVIIFDVRVKIFVLVGLDQINVSASLY